MNTDKILFATLKFDSFQVHLKFASRIRP